MRTMQWGIISTAKIGRELVVPALQSASRCEVRAIGSRDPARGQALADRLGIPVTYGSYEALLADDAIEAIYNPLPNHLHVPLTLQAAQAGKHVLCEKPLALANSDILSLIDARDQYRVHIEEAFMVQHHPQWQCAIDLVQQGNIGELRAINTVFSYYNDDPHNIRNNPDIGGGALYDIGCYGVFTARRLFSAEPLKVIGLFDRDPAFNTDRLSSFLLAFEHGQASVTVSTQMLPWQRVQILGTTGRVELEIPFNAPADGPARVFVDDGSRKDGSSRQEVSAETVDQYAAQADAFVAAATGEAAPAMTLEESRANLAVIDALFESERTGAWVSL